MIVESCQGSFGNYVMYDIVYSFGYVENMYKNRYISNIQVDVDTIIYLPFGGVTVIIRLQAG